MGEALRKLKEDKNTARTQIKQKNFTNREYRKELVNQRKPEGIAKTQGIYKDISRIRCITKTWV